MTKIRTSRKEELRSNQLLDVLAGLWRGAKKYAGYIALGAAVVAVVVVIWWRAAADRAKLEGTLAYNVHHYGRTLSADWLAYASGNSGGVTLDRFKEQADKAAGTALAARALLEYGNALLLAANTDPKLAKPTAEAARERADMVQQARSIFDRALQADGRNDTTDALAYVGLSGAARNVGDFAEAKTWAEKAKALGGASPFARKLAEDTLVWVADNEAPAELAASRPAAEATVPIPSLEPLPVVPGLGEPGMGPTPVIPPAGPVVPVPPASAPAAGAP